jgi:hypothetical protein
VIKQGEDGNDMYIVGEGYQNCFRNQGGHEHKYLLTYKPGMSFGE